jgi:hypothetical protein
LTELTVEGLVEGIRALIGEKRYKAAAVRVQGELLREEGVDVAVESVLRSARF